MKLLTSFEALVRLSAIDPLVKEYSGNLKTLIDLERLTGIRYLFIRVISFAFYSFSLLSSSTPSQIVQVTDKESSICVPKTFISGWSSASRVRPQPVQD